MKIEVIDFRLDLHSANSNILSTELGINSIFICENKKNLLKTPIYPNENPYKNPYVNLYKNPINPYKNPITLKVSALSVIIGASLLRLGQIDRQTPSHIHAHTLKNSKKMLTNLVDRTTLYKIFSWMQKN